MKWPLFRAIKVAARIGTWTYLVSYTAADGSAGRLVVCRTFAIDSLEEVQDVERYLDSLDAPGSVIGNVVLLRRSRLERWPAETTAS